MRYYKSFFFAALVLTLAPINTCAQGQHRFTNYSTENGLAAVTVNCVFKDSRGFLWLGTQNGLNRFDGRNFRTFRNDSQDSLSLIGDDIQSIREDSKGRIWVGTKNAGICYYSYNSGKFHSPQLAANYKRALLNTSSLQILNDGTLVIGTRNEGLFLFDTEKMRISDVYDRHPPGHKDLSVNSILPLADKSEYIFTIEKYGLMRAAVSGKKITGVQPVQLPFTGLIAAGPNGALFSLTAKALTKVGAKTIAPPLDSKTPIASFAFDKNGNIWVGTAGEGIYHFDTEGNLRNHFLFDAGNRTGLINSWVNDIVCDNEGNVFIATNAGLSILSVAQNVIQINSPASGRYKISSTQINAVSTTRDDNIWVGYMDAGIDCLAPSGEVKTRYREQDGSTGLPTNCVFSLYQDSRGILWAGSQRGLLKFNPQNNTFLSGFNSNDVLLAALKDKMILDFVEDDSKRLWVSAFQEGIYIFDFQTNVIINLRDNPNDRTSLSGNTVHSLYKAKDGKIWAGTNIFGISVIDPVNLKSTQFRHQPGKNNSLPSDEIFCVEGESKGTIWIGTTKGVCRYEPATNGFRTYAAREGLSSPVVFGITFDNTTPYISTFHGLYSFNPELDRFIVVGSIPEVSNTEYNQGAYFSNRFGVIYFGNAILGLVTFNPEHLKKELASFPVYLVAVKKLYKNFDSGADPCTQSHLNFTYKDYVLTFEYAALDLKNAEGLEYAFLLEGLDDNWLSTGKEAYRTFTNLNPGDYKLRARVSRDGLNWVEAASPLSLYIEPPFHQTWWFKTLGIVLFLALATGAYVLRINLLKRKQKEELEKQRLASELNAARNLQQNLLHLELPQSPRFEITARCDTALEVGGDFYDVFWYDEANGKLGVANVDISGKGMNASIGSFIIAGILTNMRTIGFENTADAATVINGSFNKKKPEKRLFAALSLAIIDLQKMTLDMTNCGQPEIILLRKGEVTFIQSNEPRLPIGVRKKIAYKNTTCDLQSGDMLFFYSDAFPESLNTEAVAYGYENIANVIRTNYTLPIEELSNALYISLEAHWRGAGVYDDASMIILKLL